MAKKRIERRGRPVGLLAEHPTSLLLPLEMNAALVRECIRRGGIAKAALIKMAIAEYLERHRPRRGKPKPEPEVVEAPPAPENSGGDTSEPRVD